MFKANFETIKKHSVQVLNKLTYLDHEAQILLKSTPFKNLAVVLNYYLENKLTNKSPEKNARWQKLKNELKLVIEKNKNNPEKLLRLIQHIELKRTVGRSHKAPLAETTTAAGTFSDCFTILKNLKNSAAQSDAAATFWRLWLAREIEQLNKYGSRSLSGYNIKEKIADGGESFLEIPTRYYKKIAEKTYEKTASTLLVKEKESVRQQMHILESINYYRQDLLTAIHELNTALTPLLNKKETKKKYYLLNNEQNILILEVLLSFQKKLARRKTADQRNALTKLQELVDFIFNNIYRRRIIPENIQSVRYFLLAIIKKLHQRINILDRQYPRLVKKRSILARNLSKKVFELFNNPKATADEIILAAELMSSIASGYTNKETLQENQFGFAEKLLQIKKQLLILASLVEHKKEKFKEFDKLIEETKTKINNLIKELKK